MKKVFFSALIFLCSVAGFYAASHSSDQTFTPIQIENIQALCQNEGVTGTVQRFSQWTPVPAN